MKIPEGKNSNSHRSFDKNKSSSFRILIVDDSESSREILEDLLLQEDYEVKVASNGMEAMDILQRHKIDLVITDLKMPGMDGIQVLKESMRINKNIAVIIITGYASLDSAIESIREGAYGYVKKPFNLDEMLILVERARERVCTIRENQQLHERIRKLESEIKLLIEKRDETEKELKRMTEIISVPQNRWDSNQELDQLIPSNRLPYKILREKNKKGFDAFHTICKLGWMRKEGLLEEEEFRIIKKGLMEWI
jgi:DNA-binding response OmpR family regulator